jgi:hypothetical protein
MSVPDRANFYLADPNLEFVTAAWPQLDAAERELEARPVADMLYHALAGALLLAERADAVARAAERARAAGRCAVCKKVAATTEALAAVTAGPS